MFTSGTSPNSNRHFNLLQRVCLHDMSSTSIRTARVFKMRRFHFSEPSILKKMCEAQINAQADVKTFFRRKVKNKAEKGEIFFHSPMLYTLLLGKKEGKKKSTFHFPLYEMCGRQNLMLLFWAKKREKRKVLFISPIMRCVAARISCFRFGQKRGKKEKYSSFPPL